MRADSINQPGDNHNYLGIEDERDEQGYFFIKQSTKYQVVVRNGLRDAKVFNMLLDLDPGYLKQEEERASLPDEVSESGHYSVVCIRVDEV